MKIYAIVSLLLIGVMSIALSIYAMRIRMWMRKMGYGPKYDKDRKFFLQASIGCAGNAMLCAIGIVIISLI